jgi:alginate O-acetyltransferase complex protein AlgI
MGDGWDEPVYVLLMVLSIAINYGSALTIIKCPAHKKLILVISVIINLSMLGYFKYMGFIFENLSQVIPALGKITFPQIALPIGISFYTFQSMSWICGITKRVSVISYG